MSEIGRSVACLTCPRCGQRPSLFKKRPMISRLVSRARFLLKTPLRMRFTRHTLPALALAGVVALMGACTGEIDTDSVETTQSLLRDRQDSVTPFSNDVYVIVDGALVTPVGTCRTEPCPAGETLPGAALFNVSST